MKLVDPMLPVTKRPQPSHRWPPTAGQSTGRVVIQRPSLSIMQPRTSSPHPQAGIASQSQPPHRPTVQAHKAAIKKAKPRKRLRNFWQPLGIMVGSLIVGLVIQSLMFGEALILLYAVYSFVRQTTSRVSFALSFLCLVGAALLLIFEPRSILPTNLAVYAFLLLVVGTIGAILEQRRRY